MEDFKNVNRFKSDFNELEKFLTKATNRAKEDGFSYKVKLFLKTKTKFNRLKDDLDIIDQVRNFIVHEEKIEDSIVIPTEALCKKLEYILNQIKNPPKWENIAIRQNEIYSCTEDDLISDVVRRMAQNTYTHVPVVKDGIFQWLLSESIYVQWLSEVSYENGIVSESSKISELKKYVDKTNDDYMFLSKDTDIYMIKEQFEKSIKERKENNLRRLGVIFISNSGKETEKILGLITAWDIGKIAE